MGEFLFLYGIIIINIDTKEDRLFSFRAYQFVATIYCRQDIQLQAGMALTIFAFNNTPKQFAIREAGGIKFSVFEPFINSNNEFHQCYSAFQVCVKSFFFMFCGGITALINDTMLRSQKCVPLRQLS